jgi:hypothetical protein
MPTKYQPLMNHQPFSADTLEAVDEFISAKSKEISEHFRKHNLNFEDDDLDGLSSEVSEALVRFILTSKALPLRSPNQLAATIKKIADDPSGFLEEMDRYDPEAVARVIAVLCRNREARNQFLEFEGGLGSPPPTEDIAGAARQALDELEQQKTNRQKGGRPVDELQKDLAIELARIYTGFGGSIGRRVHDREYGPFHEFLEIILPAVRGHGIGAKSSLTITTMVRAAQETHK